jgi:alkanesulfonate monooxygenase SsuD/methylene tetrahydromethanopterin reductase-like flavin-dependent oxidoreductase (luciferase family)
VNTTTLLVARELTEPELARALEQRFDAAWFPEYHRCSIDTEDATVYIDFDPTYGDRLQPDEKRSLTARLGFIPTAAICIQASHTYPGSPRLAETVASTLCNQFSGRALAAA